LPPSCCPPRPILGRLVRFRIAIPPLRLTDADGPSVGDPGQDLVSKLGSLEEAGGWRRGASGTSRDKCFLLRCRLAAAGRGGDSAVRWLVLATADVGKGIAVTGEADGRDGKTNVERSLRSMARERSRSDDRASKVCCRAKVGGVGCGRACAQKAIGFSTALATRTCDRQSSI
jgi:hypothetical protein